jgi:hypothetical protein
MSYYPAPDPGNSQSPDSWGTGPNDYTFPSQDRQQPLPGFHAYQAQPTANQQSAYPSQPSIYNQQSAYQAQPTTYQQPAYPYPPQPISYTPQAYVPQPQYVPVAPIIPVVAVYDPYAGQALAGLIIGIIAFVLPVFWIMPILGIIFSSLGMKSTTRKGMATAGLICSIIAIATAFCWLPFFFI